MGLVGWIRIKGFSLTYWLPAKLLIYLPQRFVNFFSKMMILCIFDCSRLKV